MNEADIPEWHRDDAHAIYRHMMAIYGRDTFRIIARRARKQVAKLVAVTLSNYQQEEPQHDYETEIRNSLEFSGRFNTYGWY
jgi:hypothetical protein